MNDQKSFCLATNKEISYSKIYREYLDTKKNYQITFTAGVGCKEEIDKGYKKIVEAESLDPPDAKSWINKYKNKNDYGA
ncbi:5147_t:CDS:2, partial [Gigaspora margarita]